MNLAEVSNVQRAADAAHFTQYERLIHKIACGFMPRAMAMGANMDYDDLFQSLCVVYTKCKATFDESRGNKFTTYLQWACYHEFNKQMEVLGRQRRAITATSVDELRGKSGEVIEGSDSYAAFIDPSQPSPEETLDAKQQIGHDLRRLGHQARSAVTLLLRPTLALEKAFKKHQEALAAVQAKVPQDITLAFILDFMQVPHSARRRIREEIRDVYGVSVPISGRV